MTTTETKPATENGELTKADRFRREVSAELSEAMAELKDRKSVWESLKSDTKEAKADVEAAQRDVNRLADEMRDIENGTYQPRLVAQPPRPNGKPAADRPQDEFAAMKLASLTEFDLPDGGRLTPKAVELMIESKFDIKTIGDLERTIAENPYWHRDISGLGPKGIDKVVEALFEFRQKYPMPTAEEQPADAETKDGAGTPDEEEGD